MTRKSRTLTDEERALWQRVTESIAPLPRQPAADRASFEALLNSSEQAGFQPGPEKPKRPHGLEQKASPRTDRRAEPPRAKDRLPGMSGGLDAATARRARRGKLPVEARIDLHGMRQVDAHGALTHFILSCAHNGKRCVLVITGKGGRRPSGDGPDAPFMRPRPEDGVLRAQLPRWLAQEPLRSRIFGMEQAHQRDGGSGAFYVFLRKAGPTR